MTTGTPLPAFEHDPLPDSATHFRLLDIIRGDFEQHVECDISTWPIDDAPSYYAISYTWGHPADTTAITVNGKPFVIRRNCEYVLQQAFASKASHYFWVDAVCIDQNTEEKNHQVGIMGEIYSRAKHVFACVGPHENDSEFLSVVILKHHSLLRTIGTMIRRVKFESWRNPIRQSKRLTVHCLLVMGVMTRRRVYDALISFLRRPYFTRLLVMQELHLARGVSYIHGPSLHSAEDLLALYWLLDLWAEPRLYRDSKVSTLMRLLVSTMGGVVASSRTKAEWELTESFAAVYPQSEHLGFSCTNTKTTLVDLVLFGEFQCSDPRDRLFGILSLVNWPGGEKPIVDYRKDKFEVALQTLELINSQGISMIVHSLGRLLTNFEITENEASLRRALAARTCASQVDTHSHRDDYSRTEKSFWDGIEICHHTRALDSVQLSNASRWQVYMPTQEHNEDCILELSNGLQVLVMQAPSETKRGDWHLRYSNSQWMNQGLGLIVRAVGNDRYTVIGQTRALGTNDRVDYDFSLEIENLVSFTGYWNAEDALVFAWTMEQLKSGATTHDQTRELVNRRVCARDGSSYFREGYRTSHEFGEEREGQTTLIHKGLQA